jgi:hypothetical protein
MKPSIGKCRIIIRVTRLSGMKIKEVIADFPASTTLGSVLERGRDIRGAYPSTEVSFAIIDAEDHSSLACT